MAEPPSLDASALAVNDPRAALARLHDLPDAARRGALELLPPSTWRDTLEALVDGPDPDTALQGALSLPESLWAQAGDAAEADAVTRLAALLHQGSYPPRLIRLLGSAASRELARATETPADHRAALGEALVRAVAERGPAEGIAFVRTREYLRLCLRELDHAPLEEVGGALSTLAAACVDAAMDAVDPSLRAAVVVFGMGKLGGSELNFLSDIDLVFVHADGAIDAPDEVQAHRQRARLHDQLRAVLRLLEGSGAWRPVFHVDLRLRPFGTRGPLSISASALERYFDRHGRGWERQAWLRARPIAGAVGLGEALLARLEPFVWPRSLGPEVFSEIAEVMKRARAQAHRGLGATGVAARAQLGQPKAEPEPAALGPFGAPRRSARRPKATHRRRAPSKFAASSPAPTPVATSPASPPPSREPAEPGALDLKHDAGGIREIEFFVQALQLLNGGRNPAVRERATLRALDRLAAGGFISDREHDVLGGAYRVLRRIEHRVQLADGQQTHLVPVTPEGREGLARRLAVGAPATWLHLRQGSSAATAPRIPGDRTSFEATLTELRGQVQAITGTLTGESELADTSEEGQRALAQDLALDPGASASARREALVSLGLWPGAVDEVGAMLEHLLGRPGAAVTASGPATAPARVGARALLLACLDSANPVEAVRRYIEFAEQRPAHFGVWRVLGAPEHGTLVRQVAELFGASEPLSRGLIGFPGTGAMAGDGGLTLLLEAFAASELARAAELRERLLDFCTNSEIDDFDARLVVFKHREFVRIGLHDLARRPDPLIIGRALSDLAELLVRELVGDLAQRRRESSSDEPSFRLAVLALGKFGMQAMDYGSDLDLMFVYEPDPGISATAARDAAQKVSRQLIARLEARIRGARLYEVDMRLRPSGGQGLLVSSLDGFLGYHARPVAVWERLALVRMRGVAEHHFGKTTKEPNSNTAPGAPDRLCQRIVDEVVPGSLWPADEEPEAIARETLRLRERIAVELARESREVIDVKTGRGGCLELELLVSALQLRHGRAGSSELRAREIPAALRALSEAGAIGLAEAQALDRAYRFLRLLLNRLRMTRASGRGQGDRLAVNSPRLTALARRMGLPDRDELLANLDRHRSEVRDTFDRHLADPPDAHAGEH
ncbi:Glutamate-ammonia-ligase adenylyltransferase [Plesiocystis pacifica SIR-1]|uniref:Glutamate-ammonia-ligase adenylyltransferase n=1 Tax=Plesiocystis pacifica SIR-1 TaxID=391625 RepID=A6GIV3_9BACT|nr:glutamine-synthetase adenylyltransferase [Plesiocystis pacifica]EDM74188.1 Glutamate-ammonia-ligase adenylyltransferase [Plesiocystis pacifica SIR-1]